MVLRLRNREIYRVGPEGGKVGGVFSQKTVARDFDFPALRQEFRVQALAD